ncbi:hypothetical protein BKP43_37170 [Variovorax boronicumulans]|nr:hypothetical protein BKP43_37170 [Variovorax boronicumulans]
MATLSVIRRWALREQMSIREIAKRTGLSRNTVKKYLRAGDEEPRYAKRTSSSKLDPYAEKLATWLAIEATKSRKQRRNLRQIHTISLHAPVVGAVHADLEIITLPHTCQNCNNKLQSLGEADSTSQKISLFATVLKNSSLAPCE